PHALAQWARIAVPVTTSEQGAFLRAGQPAVLLSTTGERPPSPAAAVNQFRMRRFGRAALRVLYALDNFRDLAQAPRDDLVIRGAPPAPIPAQALRVGGGAIAAGIALALVFALGWLVLRPALLRAAGVRQRPESPGAAVAVALITGIVAFGLWVGNPYAAGLV